MKNLIHTISHDSRSAKFMLLPVFLLMTISVQAATITWDGSTNEVWTVASNWQGNTVPGINDDVIIPGGVPVIPEISTSVTIKSLDIKEGATLEILSVGTLNINNSTGVGIRVRGELKNNGAININNTGASAMSVAGTGGNAHSGHPPCRW